MNIGTKSVSVLILAVFLTLAFPMQANAATSEQIQASIENGTAWLAAHQNPDGSWGPGNMVAETGLVLYKLIDRAKELGKDPLEVCGPSPTATCYQYAQNVTNGLNFTMTYVETVLITPQDHTAGATGTTDNPDTNINGKGLAWQADICGLVPCGDRKSYTTGIVTAALSLLDGTETAAVGPYAGTAYSVIVQDAVDWLAYAQSDLTTMWSTEGAWEYNGQNNGSGGDNSVSGYAVLGLAEAQAAGYTVPGWVKTELNAWIDYIQTDVNTPWCDNSNSGDCTGGSGYGQPGSWVNILKTGNLIEEMTLYGDSMTTPRLVNATEYITRHFFDQNTEPGWGYNLNPASYQAMFTTMKGLEFAGIDLLDMNNDSVPEFDWWLNFTDVIVAQEIPSGTPGQSFWSGGCGWGDQYLCTAWALLTLEKTAPPPPAPKGSISGMKFNDLNGNGLKDVSEPGLASWTITLTNESGDIVTNTTDTNGNYSFTELSDGNYTVGETLMAGWMQTAPETGTYEIEIKAGSNVMDKDFGNQRMPPEAACIETVNPSGKNVPVAGANPKSGQNPDGFYQLLAMDVLDPYPQIYVKDDGSGMIFGAFANGTNIKYTQDPDAMPEQKTIGGPNSAVAWHIIGTGDALVYAVNDAGVKSAEVLCKVPPPPK